MGTSKRPFSARELPVGARQWGNPLKYLPEWPARSNSRGGRGRPKQREVLLDTVRSAPRDADEPEVVPRIFTPSVRMDRGRFFIQKEEIL